ncbi:hypothetical protein R3P38DRAFT_332814 [Favolaschia claudopus]|uniref:Uncharacterized protein n=1 Tax=Favolaschia claudopus TaxID=2862362 RepID=A0AAV9ZMC9_9AGAR
MRSRLVDVLLCDGGGVLTLTSWCCRCGHERCLLMDWDPGRYSWLVSRFLCFAFCFLGSAFFSFPVFCFSLSSLFLSSFSFSLRFALFLFRSLVSVFLLYTHKPGLESPSPRPSLLFMSTHTSSLTTTFFSSPTPLPTLALTPAPAKAKAKRLPPHLPPPLRHPLHYLPLPRHRLRPRPRRGARAGRGPLWRRARRCRRGRSGRGRRRVLVLVLRRAGRRGRRRQRKL